jgi:tetraacyldisaccharide 4'-kinase
VVSVGNLTVGGTGKTPVVIWLVEALQRRGHRVAVLSRGYKRQNGSSFALVSDGTTVLAGPAEAGDEPHLIAKRCPGAVVAVGADRYRLGRWVLERFPQVDDFVLDDGFQHLALYRDVNLLLVDASAPEDLAALLPAGRLREPLAAAKRATAVLLTRADQSRDGDRLKGWAPIQAATGREERPILVRFRPSGFVNLLSGLAHDAHWGHGQSALLFSGIGNSASFRMTVQQAGVAVLDEMIFPDHHPYRTRDLDQIKALAKRCGAQLILTTEKDAGKTAPLLTPGDQVLALRVDTEILEGQERLERILFGEAPSHA